MATRALPPGLPAKVASVPPNQTLYVTNLPSNKIQKEDLRTALYMLFSTYGAVLDVVALKTMKMRGQAHIVYKDIQTATQAMRSLNGFEFFGRELSKSNIIAKLDGTFKPPAASTAAQVEVTDLQQSIFNAPLPGASANVTSRGLPPKPSASDHAMPDATAETRGTKRPREEEKKEEESDSDAEMELEDDSDDE
ncbi:uncharacterized protein PODANS_1_7200 [Podospora anserina S mat+]|uniref:Podospora anserina S mat+ genomic DNA chromosome 1, supercontig 1 n=1 Tax=Podospora anserina (strain S / ATCC MYA-4624 / DSM 980 / FGSC 10383) TaxID=515849 RepID=B2A8S1_PODAN|nr:uncharacterized protein PODANS_1_7200 [Podospora anserina S mat+]CAP60422.1 unnamed protein product [Podospora anserina S mat+]CDP23066.1 Putative U1 small nuclear ribonucleoprotein A [Podospora anserina S mat+]